MKIHIPKIIIKKLWNLWELRFSLILSLYLQTILILFSPLRKRTKNSLISFLLWSSYLMADWTANFAVGIISNGLGHNNNQKDQDDYDADILALWASFLLVHLGGPDTISAFSQEDNELWLRHLAAMVFQSTSAIYVFYRSLPDNRLWIPTIFMFLTGLTKYAERTLSLYLASLDTFRESVSPNYARIMNKYSSMKLTNYVPTSMHIVPRPVRRTKSVDRPKRGKLTDTEMVLHAYSFFETFRGLIIDHIFHFRERNKSRDFFLQRNDEDAFKVIEMELNFIYDYFFSKVSVVCSSLGYFLRITTFGLVVASLGLFYCVDKINFKDPHDVTVTYILLIGAIALDIIAFIKLITSNWLKVSIHKLPEVDLKDPIAYTDGPGNTPSHGYFGWLLHLLLRRWSESVSSYNLIDCCLNPLPPLKEKIMNFFKLTEFLDGNKYVEHKSFTKDLRKHIFDELRLKSDMADDFHTTQEINAAKGDWTLRLEGCNEFLPYILEVDYDKILLTWHIATELCYNVDVACNFDHEEHDKHKKISKLLSDYMLYLLVWKPEMVAPMGQARYRDTCAEAKMFFASDHQYHGTRRKRKYDDQEEKRKQAACDKMLGVHTEVKPAALKGEKSKSVLFDGCILAKELRKLGINKTCKWSLMSKVWVEIMCYAAINGRAYVHAQQLNKGGELITIVWFLMVHFGLGDQFKIEDQDHVRVAIVEDK